MEAITGLASGLTLAATAGINAYLPLFLLGLITRINSPDYLVSPYNTLSETWALLLLFLLLTIEILADKLPAFEILNDTIQTIVRPMAGGILVMALVAPSGKFPPVLALALGILAAGIVHATKVGFRPMVTVHSGGRAGPMVSAIEDLVATVCVFLAMVMPLPSTLITAVLLLGLFWGLHRQWDRRVEDQPSGLPPELLS
jgi:hypothetical protein